MCVKCMRTIAYSILRTTDLRTGVTNLSPKTFAYAPFDSSKKATATDEIMGKI